MLKEFFEALVKHIDTARKPSLLQTGEPSHRYAIAHADGKIEWRNAEPLPRCHKASDLSAIIELARHQAEDAGTSSVVWFSREGVVLFLDDATRRDVVKLQLHFHPQLKTLLNCEAKKEWLDQRQFLSFLRIALHDCLGDADGLLEALRRIRFRKLESGENVLAHNKASIGRSLECELTGNGPIPERILVRVPIFAGPGSHIAHAIQCAIEVDAPSEKFQLLPLPGEIEEAICKGEADIGRELIERLGDSFPIYYGNP